MPKASEKASLGAKRQKKRPLWGIRALAGGAHAPKIDYKDVKLLQRFLSERGKKRFKASSGKYAQVAVLDANTATFGTDLLKVFRENVAKAREENMRLFGSPDRVPQDQ